MSEERKGKETAMKIREWLKTVQLNEAGTGGWYVRCEWLDRNAKRSSHGAEYKVREQMLVGPFANEEDAVAFKVMAGSAESVPSKAGVWMYSDRDAQYVSRTGGEQGSVWSVLVSPTDTRVRFVQKGWKECGIEDFRVEFAVREGRYLCGLAMVEVQ